MSKSGGITLQVTQPFGGPASATLREFGGDKLTRFMLRLRLSLDCGYAAVATQGVSDNLFTVESLAALTPHHAEAEACQLPKFFEAQPTANSADEKSGLACTGAASR